MNEIDDFDCDGYRPIHHAILANDIERAKKLLNEGALLNASTESGDGALVLLCKALRDEEIVLWIPFLLSRGAEIIDFDTKGWSALHHAVHRDLRQTVRMLMASGADPFLKSKSGERPVDLAKENSEMKSLLTLRAVSDQ